MMMKRRKKRRRFKGRAERKDLILAMSLKKTRCFD
jgi:hypothetical protein